MLGQQQKLKIKLNKLLDEKPDYLEALKRILDYHDTYFKCAKCGSTTIYIGFHATEIGVPSWQLQKLLQLGILETVYRSSRSGVHYLLAQPSLVREIVKREEERTTEVDISNIKSEGEEGKTYIPEDMFSVIKGYDDIKKVILKSITSDKPVSIFLIGPPASAKSLFLEELNRLPNSYYVLAGTSTKAGLRDLVAIEKPRFLLIDELDKIRSTSDLSVLLNWMESGKLTITMHKRREVINYKGWVFAAANRVGKIPPELLSRFLRFYLKPYTEQEFRGVAVRVMIEREKKPKEIAEYIADAVLKLGSRDVRDAIKLARLCESKEEVDLVVKTMKKYKR